MKVVVQCHTVMGQEQIPLSFSLGNREFRVSEILDSSYGPDYMFFRVRADDHGLYLLQSDGDVNVWMADYLHDRRKSPRPE